MCYIWNPRALRAPANATDATPGNERDTSDSTKATTKKHTHVDLNTSSVFNVKHVPWEWLSDFSGRQGN
ncbi:hypothetical protein MTO96_009674 [Rhipicephalus appendiculatus]